MPLATMDDRSILTDPHADAFEIVRAIVQVIIRAQNGSEAALQALETIRLELSTLSEYFEEFPDAR